MAYLADNNAMNMVRDNFSQRSIGVLRGTISDIDGWLVWIRMPSMWLYGITNVVSVFSWKGFYALNVQFIVDYNKKVL